MMGDKERLLKNIRHIMKFYKNNPPLQLVEDFAYQEFLHAAFAVDAAWLGVYWQSAAEPFQLALQIYHDSDMLNRPWELIRKQFDRALANYGMAGEDLNGYTADFADKLWTAVKEMYDAEATE